jgi:hypothetical protein
MRRCCNYNKGRQRDHLRKSSTYPICITLLAEKCQRANCIHGERPEAIPICRALIIHIQVRVYGVIDAQKDETLGDDDEMGAQLA